MADDAEILRISRHLLLSSPPGQFDLILSDLRSIVPSPSVFTEDWVDDVRKDYKARTDYTVAIGDDSSETNALCKCVKEKVSRRVVQDKYDSRKGVTSNCFVTMADHGGSRVLDVFVVRENVANLNKCYAGSWTGRYTATFAANGGCEVKGVAQVHAHSFENGNVQFQCKREFAPERLKVEGIDNDGADATAECIAERIDTWEMSLLDALRDMYRGMGDTMLKSLRRVMPITRTRMEWNVQPHRMVKTINSDVSSG